MGRGNILGACPDQENVTGVVYRPGPEPRKVGSAHAMEVYVGDGFFFASCTFRFLPYITEVRLFREGMAAGMSTRL